MVMVFKVKLVFNFFHSGLPLVFCCTLISITSSSQIISDRRVFNPEAFAFTINKKIAALDASILRKSCKILLKMQNREVKIYKHILKGKDSTEVRKQVAAIRSSYNAIGNSLRSGLPGQTGNYIPSLDSLSTALKFIREGSSNSQAVLNALKNAEALKQRFASSEEISKFLKQRKELLKQKLEQLGLTRQLKKLNKEIYYYQAQVKEYKEILADPKKIERKALELLSKSKLFRDFFQKNSLLASLFRMPGDPNDPAYLASLQGLQTRAQVNAMIQQQVMSGGPNAMEQFRQNLQSAQGQLNQLKDRIMKAGGGSSDAGMADGFKPNMQKTKSFWKRLELGTNLQSQKSTGILPVRSDLGLSVGYKLNDRSVIGFGGSYRLGWGRGWQHMRLSSEGMSLRSYVDWKLKGSFYISGGFEMNYNAAFSSLSLNADTWQESGLIGISKQVPLKTKFFKKTKLLLLWDFLSYKQVPGSQQLIFRIGYSFK